MIAPWVFTPENLEILSRMRADGATSRQMAEAIGSTADSVRQTLLNKHRNRKRPQDHKIEFRVTASTKDQLYAEAARRGMKPRTMVRKVLLTIVNDNLFAAILDDDGR